MCSLNKYQLEPGRSASGLASIGAGNDSDAYYHSAMETMWGKGMKRHSLVTSALTLQVLKLVRSLIRSAEALSLLVEQQGWLTALAFL